MKQDVKKIFNDNNVDIVKFYYCKTPLTNNIFTVCLFINKQKKVIVARGITICSLKDTYNKGKGKNIAFGRALRALIKKENYLKVKSTNRKEEFVNRTFKIKNDKAKRFFQTQVTKELVNINPNLPIVRTTSKNITIYKFQLPLNYPIELTHKYFKYKSSYKPNPVTPEEISYMKTLE